MEEAPRFALYGAGKLALSYTTTSGKSGRAVHLRLPGGEPDAPGRNLLVSKGRPGAYGGIPAADGRGRLWVFYTALSDSGRFDVFGRRLDERGRLAAAVNLTGSDDDAMYPAAACDGEGNLWVAYYRWRRMGPFSRDKEVYARSFDGRKWGPEVHLSPEDVPEYEDHTDPAAVLLPSGGVAVAWSWDMHPLKKEPYRRIQDGYGAGNPTIFGRAVTRAEGAGALLFLGHAGWDDAPVLAALPGGRLACAWQSLVYSGAGPRKALYSSFTSPPETERAEQFPIEEGLLDVGSPAMIEKGGALYVIWPSRSEGEGWVLKKSVFTGAKWSRPVVVEKEGEPREVTAARDGRGRVWIAFVHDGSKGREVACRVLDLGERGGSAGPAPGGKEGGAERER